MATSSRIRGNVKPVFTLKIGAGTATSFSDDLKKVELKSNDKDSKDLTFAEVAGGVGLDYTLTLTAISSFDAASLYRYLWANAGTVVAFDYGPLGNATPSASQPHFVGSVTLKRPDFELEATAELTGAEFEIELAATTDVTLATS